jgi:hypothetical protein
MLRISARYWVSIAPFSENYTMDPRHKGALQMLKLARAFAHGQ